ncbi:MAG: sec-independent protein translocase protein TatC [Cognaticolwellia sp.]|jgi:sec-independent protein translocase protein TatC
MKDPALEPVEDTRMPIMEHLADLRTRLIRAGVAAGVGIGIASAFSGYLFDFLVDPMRRALAARGSTEGLTPVEQAQLTESMNSLVITDPMEGVVTYLKVAVIAGLLMASPIIFYQIWAFVAPGLYKSEKRTVIPLVMASTLLFLAGASFGYFVIFEYGFAFFLGVLDFDTGAAISLNSYLGTATKLLGAFGFSFQLPVVVFFISRMGLIDHKDMIAFFRYAIVGVFVISAVITPPDPLTQTLMAGPLLLLYCMSIGISFAFSTKVRGEDGEAVPADKSESFPRE